MSISPVNNHSILALQSSIRGYLARRSLGKRRVESFAKLSKADANHLTKVLFKIAETIEFKWVHSEIGQLDQSYALLKLKTLKACLSIHNESLRQTKNQNFSTKNEELDYLGEIIDEQKAHLAHLRDVFTRIGCMSLKKGLQLMLEDSFANLPKKSKAILKEYNGIFNPAGCRIFPHEFEGELPTFQYLTNFPATCLMDTLNGAELWVPFIDNQGKKSLAVIKGHFKTNPIVYQDSYKTLNTKFYRILDRLNSLSDIPITFLNTYLNQYPIRELILKQDDDIISDVRIDYNNSVKMMSLNINDLYRYFTELSLGQKIRALGLMLMKDHPLAAIALYQHISKEMPDFARLVRNSLHFTLQSKLQIDTESLNTSIQKLAELNPQTVDYEARIAISKLDDGTKAKAMEKLRISKGNYAAEAIKAQQYLNTLLSVPFGIYTQEAPGNISDRIKEMSEKLDQTVYGQTNSKKAILEWYGQRLQNPDSKGACIALSGPPGTGKTTLALGIAKALNRPFGFIQLAGKKDGVYLTGHDYTYISAKCGRIIEILIESRCMDPVIFIDEADKLSSEEIMSLLIMITDFSQNHSFEQDNYFSGIKFDLSKILFIFAFNDKNKIDRILRDRMQIIDVEPQSLDEKCHVSRDHLMPEILKSCGFKEGEVFIHDEDLRFIIENYTIEGGARKLKEKLFSIVRQINLQRIMEPASVLLPFKITREVILKTLNEPSIEFKKIAKEPAVGTINGLYATVTGLGGLTIIQVMQTLANQRLELKLTGSQGAVMQESMAVARTVAWNVLPQDVKENIQKSSPQGLHIHCPEGSTPKDGPSAGGAITVAIVSRLTGKAIRNDVAMTGEIDLNGNITKIGGLNAKLHGAKKAGVRLVLVPRENENDILQLQRKFPKLFDDTFEVKLIDTIHDALKYCME